MEIKLIKAFLKDLCKNPLDGIKRSLDIILHGSTKTERLNRMWMAARQEILSWSKSEHDKYLDECNALESLSTPKIFFYPRVKSGDEIEGGYDDSNKLHFAVHNGKRLYYSSDFDDGPEAYAYSTEIEGLLGTGCLAKSPHSYVNKLHFVEEGDVVLDIGCAEALFALDSIEKASRVYLFECDDIWCKPLDLTFGKYGDKVFFVRKLVSDKTQGNEIALEDAIKEPEGATFFMKMDIEGWEQAVLKASERFLKSHKIKLSCCTYHRQEDAEVISNILRSYGFTVRFSDGYMLPWMNGFVAPYFRKGMIYARNY